MKKLQRYSATTSGGGNDYCLAEDEDGTLCTDYHVEKLEEEIAKSDQRLQAFLYLLARDHLPTGTIEKLLEIVPCWVANFTCPLLEALSWRWVNDLGAKGIDEQE